MLGINSVLYFPMIKHNATKISADALYLVRKIIFCKVNIAFVGNLFYRFSHKKDSMCCLLESFKNFETLTAADIIGDRFDLAQT